ncbi:acyl-[acyl-carrier-protein]--UDP-N-acetylglucosamine O-acyltransferase [bacterium F11]|nr:acyl-[acyl-carrier-protein]--UDP-N-acetylglucosamine O-acyltransferase [bacterium F11]
MHSSAIIDSKAQIGVNVKIDAYSVIGPDVKIGDDCHIMSHTIIQHTQLGKGCLVYPQASLGLEPQHFKYKGEKTQLVVGENCIFREGVTVHRGTLLDKGVTKIGNKGYFMALSHIAHDCSIGDNVILANAAQLAGHTNIGNNVFVSTMVGIHQFVRIGTGALISGGAMVPMDIAPFCIAQGDRATLRGLNVIGMRRSGINRDSISKIKKAYHAVFMSGLKLDEALNDPALNINDDNVSLFKEFLSVPHRGFVRPENKSNVLQEEPVG